MTPLLAPGDYLLTRRFKAKHQPERGDLIVFRSGNQYLIKRVIGLPGETVSIEAGMLMIDKTPLDEPWWSAATRPDGEWQVAEDHWFVLGDNRLDSAHDSRSNGPISRPALHSRAVACYWPPSRARRLP